jgi:hypothetical protein
MGHRIITTGIFAVAAIAATAALAQPPAAPAGGNVAVEHPTYVSIPMEVMVNKPAAEVWAKVGKFCDLGAWMRIDCKISAGQDGQFGAVRAIAGGRVTEVLVGWTPLSYTYTQPVAPGRPYNLYHGTLEARPVTATTSKLVYTLTYDNSMLPDDAARTRDLAQKRAQFEGALANMKIIAEGGTLPPPPPRPAPPAAK